MSIFGFFFEGGNERVERARQVEAKSQKAVIASNAQIAQQRARVRRERAERDEKARKDKAYAKELKETRAAVAKANEQNRKVARARGHTYMDKQPAPKSHWWD